ncbi:MAG: hypothetical protein EA412_06760 [Chitinophagaceae bacterium]|nr:MAG: hypothetical protein EA412_06760 [Chitinophagaceae bacterium]
MNILYAQHVETVNSGNWSSTNTWSTGSLPTQNDSIVIKHDVLFNVNFTVNNVINIESGVGLVYSGNNRKLTLSPGSRLHNNGNLKIQKVDNNAGTINNYGIFESSDELNNNPILAQGAVLEDAVINNYGDMIVKNPGNGASAKLNNNGGSIYNYNYLMVSDLNNNEPGFIYIDEDGMIETDRPVQNNGTIYNNGVFYSPSNFINNNGTITGNGGSFVLESNFIMNNNGIATCDGGPIDICGPDGTMPGGTGLNNIDPNCVSVCGVLQSALPVELLYFDVRLNDKQVELEWSTSTEINNDYFQILKSYDANNWEVIQTVKSQNPNSVEQLTYSTTDYDYNAGVSITYYRLKQVDFDGTDEYFEIKSVSQNLLKNIEVSVYPNPVVDVLFLRADKLSVDNIVVEIVNTMGQSVFKFIYDTLPSEGISTQNLAPGLYNLIVYSEGKKLLSEPLIKK